MPEASVLTWIKDLGFPVAVAAYVLIRLEHVLRQIRDDQRDLMGLLGGRRRLDGRRRSAH